MGVAAWFSRRVLRADLRPSEIVTATGASAIRLEDYIADGPGGRLFWRIGTALYTALGLAATVLMLALPWVHPTAQPGAPAWHVWPFGLLGAVFAGSGTAFLAAGLRAMHRHRADPRTDPADD
jgi:hypothetical protein